MDDPDKTSTILHISSCRETAEDMKLMEQKMRDNPCLLHQTQEMSDKNCRELMTAAEEHRDESVNRSLHALHDCVMRGHVKCAKFLIERGASIEKKSPTSGHGATPLELALHYFPEDEPTYMKMIQILLEMGATPNKYLNGYILPNSVVKAVHLDSAYGVAALRTLLQNGALMDAKKYNESKQLIAAPRAYLQESACTPLMSAISYQRHAAIKELLLHGAIKQILIKRTDAYDLSSPPVIFFIIVTHLAMFGKNDALKHITPQENTQCALQAVRIFHTFGGNLWEKGLFEETNDNTTNSVKSVNVLHILKRSPKFQALLPGLTIELKNMMSIPRTLKEISRLKILTIMGGSEYVKNIKKLCIPCELQDYLEFRDVTTRRFN